jgi:hypothetical protein
MTDSLPYWQEVILDRIDSHRSGMHDSQVLQDIDGVDAHAIALEELEYICNALGIVFIND